MKLDFIQDPGHGWLKVPRKLLHELNIEHKITHYSYQRADFVYLEEDCDYSTFQAAMNQAGRAFTCRDRVACEKRSKIRSYETFRPALETALRTAIPAAAAMMDTGRLIILRAE
jgi:hypothetical protein